MYRNRGEAKYAFSQGGEPGMHLHVHVDAYVHAVEALTDGQVEGSAREFRIEIEFFAPGMALNERECAKPPAGQQCARLATGGSITIAGAIPILCSV